MTRIRIEGDMKRYASIDCCLGGRVDCDDPIGEPGYLIAQEMRRAETLGFTLEDVNPEIMYTGPAGRRYVIAAKIWRKDEADTHFSADRGNETYTDLLVVDWPPSVDLAQSLLPVERAEEIDPIFGGLQKRFDLVREERERKDELEDDS